MRRHRKRRKGKGIYKERKKGEKEESKDMRLSKKTGKVKKRRNEKMELREK